MERKYTILAAFLMVLALGLILLPKRSELKEIDPETVLNEVAGKSRYLSADQVTHRIIENDPTLLLIDLRPAVQFNEFSLPGAINIQAENLLKPETLKMLIQPGKEKVFFANSDIAAEKAWLILTRYSIGRAYVLKGGLNEWFNTIIKPGETLPTASSSDLDLLSFRKAARQYFTGEGQAQEISKPKTPAKVNVVRKAPQAATGGGC